MIQHLTTAYSPGQPVDADLLERKVLPRVFKPGRYLGLEEGAARKSFGKAKVTMALAFPDLYEIGISNYGLKLLYSLVNRQKDYMCDRVYAAAPDMMDVLKEYGMPLYGVESRVPLKDFDLLAFSLQYELNYTTILGILESAQIPFRAADRDDNYPLLMAGGPGSANPMPLAPFFDAFIIGDGEHVLLEILALMDRAKREKWPKARQLQEIAKLDGMYVPGITQQAYKRIVDIAEDPVEMMPLVPSVAAVHDRVVIEARRGCDRMCRFCQPCFINLPVREQSIETIKNTALKEIAETGYEECSLLSLSIADYSYLKPLITEVADALKEQNVSLSLPSQRADRFNLEVAEAVQQVRKSTLTFAPEAGTPRLRDVINKNLTDAEIMSAVTTSYKAGWNKVKLYFIIGLPTETNEDLDGIVDIATRMRAECARIKRDPELSIRNHLEINITLSNFVPKPHTPFQWFPQDSMDTLRQKIRYLRDRFRGMKGVKLNFTDPEISKLEAVISRGGPELADVLEAAYRKGAYLDAWDDVENFRKWYDALTENGFDPETYTRERLTDPDEPLPWDCVDMGLDKKWLREEYEKAKLAGSTVPCFEACSTCGVCGKYSTWPKFIETPREKPRLKVAKGNSFEDRPEQLRKPPINKVRLKLEKRGGLRFISHLDWIRILHRALKRSGIPVGYSQGFNPKFNTSFGPPVPLFTESACEYVDVELTDPVTEIGAKLNRYLPEGGKVLEEVLLPLSASSIDKSMKFIDYYAGWTCKDDQTRYTINNRVQFVTTQSALPVTVETKKARKDLDLAPYLSDLRMEGDSAIRFRINRITDETGQPAMIKPEWLLDLIDPGADWAIMRTNIGLEARQPGSV